LHDELWAERDYHLPADLRAIVHAIRNSRSQLRLTSSTGPRRRPKLLCCTLARLRERTLVPLVADVRCPNTTWREWLPPAALIDERWNQRLPWRLSRGNVASAAQS
jgi:hypothetical protein